MLLAPVWSAVADVAEIGSGTTVLDVGCGTGGFCALAAERGALVHGIDGLPDRIERAQRRVPAGDFRVRSDGGAAVARGLVRRGHGLQLVPVRLRRRDGPARGASGDAAGATARGVQVGPPEDNEFFAFLGVLGTVDGGSAQTPSTRRSSGWGSRRRSTPTVRS
jgi:SAM-dependent methyltransferase